MDYGYINDAFYDQYTDIYRKVNTLTEGSKSKIIRHSSTTDKLLVKLGDVVLEPKNQEGIATPYLDGDIVQFKARECIRLSGEDTRPSLTRFDDNIDPLVDDGATFDIGANIYGWGIEPLTFTDQDELDDLIESIEDKYKDEIVEVTARGIFPDTEAEGFEAEEGYQAWGLTSAIAEDASVRSWVVITSVIDASTYIGDVLDAPSGSVLIADIDISIVDAVSNAADIGDAGFADKLNVNGSDMYYLQSMLLL